MQADADIAGLCQFGWIREGAATWRGRRRSDGLPKPDASPMIVDTIKVSRSGASNLL
ncbi:MAG TPA: hypothetical protein VNS33_05520 [Bradyrhizobium sp.]|nr:hypothetical protein [Bradyrhizobium sp.]